MLSHRLRNAQILRSITYGLLVVSIVGWVLAGFFFFVADTGQFIEGANVEPQWQASKTSAIVGLVCSPLAIGFFISHRIARNALERYEVTHCSDCGFNMKGLIAERRTSRNEARKTGDAIHTSLYFEVTCPACMRQRLVRD